MPSPRDREAGLGDPTYRVNDKIFAMEKRGGGISVWCKVPEGLQSVMVADDPRRFFVPPYVGVKGWIGIRLDGDARWEEIAALVLRSFRMTAPKRFALSADVVNASPTAPPIRR